MQNLSDKQIQILTVAEKLFAEKGYDGTSIRHIAKEAGINIAMVSYYFGSKEKMLEALIYYRTSDLKMQLDSLFREEIPVMQKLDKLIELFLARVEKNRFIYQIIHTELANSHRGIDLQYFTEVKKGNLALVEQIIKQGQDEGVFGKNVNTSLIPTTILGIYFQFHINRPLFAQVFGLGGDASFSSYVKNELTSHIKQTIKALLTHEIS